MTWSIGTFTFSASETPLPDSVVDQSGGEQVWSEFDAVGGVQTILTYLATKSPRHELHAKVIAASRNSLKAIRDARAVVAFIHPWNATGESVQMVKFVSKPDPVVPERFEVWMTLVAR